MVLQNVKKLHQETFNLFCCPLSAFSFPPVMAQSANLSECLVLEPSKIRPFLRDPSIQGIAKG